MKKITHSLSIHPSINSDGIGSELGNDLRFEFNALQTVARIRLLFFLLSFVLPLHQRVEYSL